MLVTIILSMVLALLLRVLVRLLSVCTEEKRQKFLKKMEQKTADLKSMDADKFNTANKISIFIFVLLILFIASLIGK